ncbi:CPBP family intramembrane metalloprotease [Lysinibacillus xylanilyticus]|uniref:CPBP family intramembrane glutamic endopeptidase n=1 Tax=Lysinibacillus xylanilyticus TaxID=582475 RepID=UPI002B24F552|nr:type II CAAX endopeptidase family protein [Lysinibacillus xylanilyticus]MEB2282688.1 CPBP family intramembrane metalloprotease [Lysinibacillus xylanilyticus]
MESRLSVASEKNNEIKTKMGFLLLFYFSWTIKELWLIDYIYSFGEIISPLLEAFVKGFIWIVPTWLYIKYYLHTYPFDFLRMNVNVIRGLFWGVVLSLLVGIYFAFDTYIINQQSFQFSLSIDDYLNVFLMAGIAEEIVFRGLILQEINKKMTFWKANVLTALLFLVIHYPVWIYNEKFFHFGTHVYVLILGLLFGLVYKKTGSLWSVIILHVLHNFFVTII